MAALRRILPVLALAAALLWVWVLANSAVELERGRRAEAGELPEEALEHYLRSLGWYAPGNPFAAEAGEKAFALAAAEVKEQPAEALRAFRLIRGEILGSRWLVTPHRDLLDRCDVPIAALVSSGVGVEGPPAGRPEGDGKRKVIPWEGGTPSDKEVLAELERPRPPRRGWVLLSALAFPAWIILVIRALWTRGEPGGGRKAWAWAAGGAAAFLLWTAGLILA